MNALRLGGKRVEVRDCNLGDLQTVLQLLRQGKATVGFLPDEAVEQRIHKGTLLVATVDDRITGYLLYDLPANSVAIRQLVIARRHRKSGVARALVDELVRRHQENLRGIRLWCRRDYEANDVWHRLGFSPRNERPGRGKGGKVLTLWWRSFGQPDLFSLAREADDRPVAALDTQLLIWGSDGRLLITEDLLADWVRAEVVFGIIDHSLVEMNGRADLVERQTHIQYALGFEDLRMRPEAADRLITEVHKVLGAAAEPHRADILLAVRAATASARWFVTEDIGFRQACAATLKELADIDVVSVSEMILAADQLVRGDTYQGRYLQGTDIEVREVTTGDLDSVARIFLSQSAGETFKVWRARLHGLATDVARNRLYLMCDQSKPVALAAVTAGAVLEVPICRVRRGPAEPTLARQLLGWLRDKCIEVGAAAVRITDEHPGQWIVSRCVNEGFLPDVTPTAVPMTGPATIRQISAALATPPLVDYLRPQHAEALAALTPSPEAAHSVESVFHPVIVTGAGLRTIRVPIKPHYAIELFDHALSEGRLWGRERSVALRREHVYFRSPTSPALFTTPARILWQVTGDRRFGGRTLRGWSLLDDVVVGDVSQLIKRFSHLGVLNEAQIREFARDGSVMALRFSHTTVFRRPLSLADYRGVMNDLEPGKGLTHFPQPVAERTFVRLATMAT